jgi:hypothetical protein
VESTKGHYSTNAYFNRHMSRMHEAHEEMLHRSKIQKTSNECDFGDKDNDTTECFDDKTCFIVDCVPEEVKESEVQEDDDGVPTLVSRAASASDDE